MTETPSGYVLHEGTPTLADYIRLRADSGLTPRTSEQAAPALLGSWAACHVVERATDETVGMGRLIGDGGWYFHVVDMAVLPLHQRRGIGNCVLTWLLDQIRRSAPPDAFVSLMADPPGRRLYGRHGFTERRDLSVGMAMWLGREDVGAEAAVPESGDAVPATGRHLPGPALPSPVETDDGEGLLSGSRWVIGEGDAALDRRLSDELDAYNVAAAGAGEQREFSVKAEDDHGALVAGLSGWTWGTSAGIAMVWVREDARASGLGRHLLAAAERIARERGCERINASSFTFQAPGFYAKHGYVETGRTEALPGAGQADVHFVKHLS